LVFAGDGAFVAEQAEGKPGAVTGAAFHRNIAALQLGKLF